MMTFQQLNKLPVRELVSSNSTIKRRAITADMLNMIDADSKKQVEMVDVQPTAVLQWRQQVV